MKWLAVGMCLAMVGMAVMGPTISGCKLGAALTVAYAKQHRYGESMFAGTTTALLARQVVLEGIAIATAEELALVTAAEFALAFVPVAGIAIA